MKKYKLQRKSFTNVVFNNFSATLKSFGAFVGCSSLTGISYGIVRSFALADQSRGVVEDNGGIAPILFFCFSIYYAKQLYDNFKKDKARFLRLADEIEKDRQRKRRLNENVETQKYTPSDDSEYIEGSTAGKRKSLNNGIFKSNDIY